jgi:membrane protein implicated in regulation of membrane protease activity
LPFIWIGAAVLFAIIEAATLGLATIWFALGALLGMVCALLKLPFSVQMIVFLLASIVLLYFTRPIAQKALKIGNTRTNADSLIGKTGFVQKSIRQYELGQVKVEGQVWSARSVDRQDIEEGNEVEVTAIEGVKLLVKKIRE